MSDILRDATEEFKADKDVVLAVIARDGFVDSGTGGLALELASDALKADKEVVLAAIEQVGPPFSERFENARDAPRISLTRFGAHRRRVWTSRRSPPISHRSLGP